MKVRQESKFQIDEEKKLHQEGAEQKFNFSIFFLFFGFSNRYEEYAEERNS